MDTLPNNTSETNSKKKRGSLSKKPKTVRQLFINNTENLSQSQISRKPKMSITSRKPKMSITSRKPKMSITSRKPKMSITSRRPKSENKLNSEKYKNMIFDFKTNEKLKNFIDDFRNLVYNNAIKIHKTTIYKDFIKKNNFIKSMIDSTQMQQNNTSVENNQRGGLFSTINEKTIQGLLDIITLDVNEIDLFTKKYNIGNYCRDHPLTLQYHNNPIYQIYISSLISQIIIIQLCMHFNLNDNIIYIYDFCNFKYSFKYLSKAQNHKKAVNIIKEFTTRLNSDYNFMVDIYDTRLLRIEGNLFIIGLNWMSLTVPHVTLTTKTITKKQNTITNFHNAYYFKIKDDNNNIISIPIFPIHLDIHNSGDYDSDYKTKIIIYKLGDADKIYDVYIPHNNNGYKGSSIDDITCILLFEKLKTKFSNIQCKFISFDKYSEYNNSDQITYYGYNNDNNINEYIHDSFSVIRNKIENIQQLLPIEYNLDIKHGSNISLSSLYWLSLLFNKRNRNYPKEINNLRLIYNAKDITGFPIYNINGETPAQVQAQAQAQAQLQAQAQAVKKAQLEKLIENHKMLKKKAEEAKKAQLEKLREKHKMTKREARFAQQPAQKKAKRTKKSTTNNNNNNNSQQNAKRHKN